MFSGLWFCSFYTQFDIILVMEQGEMSIKDILMQFIFLFLWKKALEFLLLSYIQRFVY